MSGPWISRVSNYIFCPFTFAFCSLVENSTRRPCCVSWIIHVAEQRELSSQPLPIIDGSLFISHNFDDNQASVILENNKIIVLVDT